MADNMQNYSSLSSGLDMFSVKYNMNLHMFLHTNKYKNQALKVEGRITLGATNQHDWFTLNEFSNCAFYYSGNVIAVRK